MQEAIETDIFIDIIEGASNIQITRLKKDFTNDQTLKLMRLNPTWGPNERNNNTTGRLRKAKKYRKMNFYKKRGDKVQKIEEEY